MFKNFTMSILNRFYSGWQDIQQFSALTANVIATFNGRVTRSEFSSLRFWEHSPVVQNVAFVPRVTAEVEEKFLREGKQNSVKGEAFSFKGPSSTEPAFFPVHFIEPSSCWWDILGLRSTVDDMEFVRETAAQKGGFVVSNRVELAPSFAKDAFGREPSEEEKKHTLKELCDGCPTKYEDPQKGVVVWVPLYKDYECSGQSLSVSSWDQDYHESLAGLSEVPGERPFAVTEKRIRETEGKETELPLFGFVTLGLSLPQFLRSVLRDQDASDVWVTLYSQETVFQGDKRNWLDAETTDDPVEQLRKQPAIYLTHYCFAEHAREQKRGERGCPSYGEMEDRLLRAENVVTLDQWRQTLDPNECPIQASCDDDGGCQAVKGFEVAPGKWWFLEIRTLPAFVKARRTPLPWVVFGIAILTIFIDYFTLFLSWIQFIGRQFAKICSRCCCCPNRKRKSSTPGQRTEMEGKSAAAGLQSLSRLQSSQQQQSQQQTEKEKDTMQGKCTLSKSLYEKICLEEAVNATPAESLNIDTESPKEHTGFLKEQPPPQITVELPIPQDHDTISESEFSSAHHCSLGSPKTSPKLGKTNTFFDAIHHYHRRTETDSSSARSPSGCSSPCPSKEDSPVSVVEVEEARKQKGEDEEESEDEEQIDVEIDVNEDQEGQISLPYPTSSVV
uniref:Uncharacterized protein n=1 Tax=Chromera velia CCMP2878 TaxID=1169474 RepID=A0A0G4HDE4_9ALVE|eukprot:Cvel_6421.t1-p1 / transcript=Cvel_6421.t1 / gene=Cvel_6421 / organism=Chromera_velia_CCMP2878 / gene_product=hypothetical protein / transcript_product=hypothetical protein / location=Cvel_scaffold314:37453-40986(-) / protein_length=671 / sequence_SO=supercontig / SO=protein_coding / is_pseudo=false